VLGFYHNSLIADYSHNMVTIGRFLSICRDRLIVWKGWTVGYLKMPADYLRRLRAMTSKGWGFGRHIVNVLAWLVSTPWLFIAWLRKSSKNRANVITFLMLPIIAVTLWKFGYLALVFGPTSVMEQKDAPIWLEIASFGIIMGTIFAVFSPILLLGMRNGNGETNDHSWSERYDRYGSIGWAFYELKNAFMFSAFAFIFAELMLFGLAIIATLAVITLAFIIAIFTPARVFWKCVQLPGHWFCFGVTTVTTLVAWLVMRSYVVNPAAAWILALGNGIIAAVATEALRHTYEWLVSRWSWLRELIQLKGFYDDPDDVTNYLGRTLGKPVISAITGAWHAIESRLPHFRLCQDSWWRPV
jgi:hypothetical protein